MRQPTVVFLHGIGEGDPDQTWLTALNRGLVQVGAEPLPEDTIIAPRYSDLLKATNIDEKLPPVTYKVKDDRDSRRDFERRQARVQRILAHNPTVRIHGFNRVPGPVLRRGQSVAVDYAIGVLKQVRNYVYEDNRCGAVMNRILKKLSGVRGQIVLIGHSLGSVIAIDLLDHLPESVHVRRFITIGSPAHSPVLHRASDRLLKKFPYALVDDWSNFLETRDVVTGGRGLASVFPGAQDFVIDNGGSHDAANYLSHEAVAGLIRDVIYPRPPRSPSAETGLVARLDDADALAPLSLQFGRRLSTKIDKKEVRKRYEDALLIIQEDFAAKASELRAEGRPVAPELEDLIDGQLPSVRGRWEPQEAVRHSRSSQRRTRLLRMRSTLTELNSKPLPMWRWTSVYEAHLAIGSEKRSRLSTTSLCRSKGF